MAAGVIDELCAETNCAFRSETGWVKRLLLCRTDEHSAPSADIIITGWLLFITAVIPRVMRCGSPRGPTAVRRSIHRLSVPSHRRPLPPCAATPALNGGSPSGGERERLKAAESGGRKRSTSSGPRRLSVDPGSEREKGCRHEGDDRRHRDFASVDAGWERD